MNKDFIKKAAIRAVRTFCQAAVATIGTGTIGITEVDWLSVLSVSAMAAVLSFITSFATGLPEA